MLPDFQIFIVRHLSLSISVLMLVGCRVRTLGWCSAWCVLQLGNHDKNRVSSRLGSDLIDALNMVILLLPGTPVTYYGEEIGEGCSRKAFYPSPCLLPAILTSFRQSRALSHLRSLSTGMEDTDISWEDTVDPSGCSWGPDLYHKYSRDPARTPMQWDDTDFAGEDVWLLFGVVYCRVHLRTLNFSREPKLTRGWCISVCVRCVAVHSMILLFTVSHKSNSWLSLVMQPFINFSSHSVPLTPLPCLHRVHQW